MRIKGDGTSYDWVDGWAKIPDTESAQAGFAHTGVVVTEDGSVVTFHPGDPTVLTFDGDGNLLIQHFPDEPRGRVVIGKKATHLSRIREHHSW